MHCVDIWGNSFQSNYIITIGDTKLWTFNEPHLSIERQALCYPKWPESPTHVHVHITLNGYGQIWMLLIVSMEILAAYQVVCFTEDFILDNIEVLVW